MKFNRDKLSKMTSLDDVELEIFNEQELAEVRSAAEQRALVRRSMSEEISKAITAYMAQEDIGFNEFQRRLGVSSATVSKLLKGDANVTLDTISAVSQLMGVMPELKFHKAGMFR